MNGWNRLFVVVAVVWALVAPFWLVAENNKPAERIYSMCTDTAYHLYGSSDSGKLDMDRYRAEGAICMERFMHGNLISWPGTLTAMVGLGDWKLGAIAWGFILIPLALVWLVIWAAARIVIWIIAGFRDNPRQRERG
jgi:hypothetical protein